MPSFQDSAVLILIALLLFGPKGMAQLARQLGKLMAEFRRASTEFRMQMEDEFRASEQAEQQKKIAAMEAAAPVAPAFPNEFQADIPEPEHPHTSPYTAAGEPAPSGTPGDRNDIHPEDPLDTHHIDARPAPEPAPAPLPIASSGDLHLMPPATGLPIPRSASATASPAPSTNGFFDSIPHVPDPEHAAEETAHG